jgi:two-component system NtrC family response regulator
MNSSVLIIDDDPRFTRQMEFALSKEGYKVWTAATASVAMELVNRMPFNCAIIDVHLPDVLGIALTEQIKQSSPQTEIIIMTAFGTIEDGVKAMKAGAMDYSVKTSDLEHTLLLVQRACEKAALAQRIEQLVQQLGAPQAFASIIGISSSLQKAVQLAKTIAPTDIAVLILGETGTGKELFARAIHDASLRKHSDFVAINCSAIPADLLESELFGYRKGAFTGAFHDKVGLLAKAGEGTLFLDEIGDMPLALQTKILRVLETRECTPLGGTEPFAFQARVIAATNADIFQKISLGSFRSDLYYRLEGFVLELPPLRERKDDIDVLTGYFITIFSTKYKKNISRIHEQFQQWLYDYPWYGNIREFRNVLERAVLLCPNGVLTQDILTASMPQARLAQPSTPPTLPPQAIQSQAVSPSPFPSSSSISTFETEIQSFSSNLLNERSRILHVLQQTNGERSQAAKLLGISIATLYRKLKKYHLEHYGKRFEV